MPSKRWFVRFLLLAWLGTCLSDQNISSAETSVRKVQPAYKIFGSDNRVSVSDTTVFPYSSIGLIEAYFSNELRTGTGVMIGPKTVLTVAHVVYDSQLGFAKNVYFIPGCNGDTEPFGRFGVTTTIVRNEWKNDANEEYDLAMLILDTRVGDDTGIMKIEVVPESFFSSAALYSAGYPSDLGSIYMYKVDGTGTGTGVDGNMFLHTIDTEPGQSGSPVWKTDGTTSSIRVVGLMKGTLETTTSKGTTEEGIGMWIDQDFADWIETNLAKHDTAQDISSNSTSTVTGGGCSGFGFPVFLMTIAGFLMLRQNENNS